MPTKIGQAKPEKRTKAKGHEMREDADAKTVTILRDSDGATLCRIVNNMQVETHPDFSELGSHDRLVMWNELKAGAEQ